MSVFNIPHITRLSGYAKPVITAKKIEEYNYLLNKNIKDIILFEDSKEGEEYIDKIILPRHYHIFVGTKNGDLMFKPYEYDQYRIVVSTYNNIIIEINSLG